MFGWLKRRRRRRLRQQPFPAAWLAILERNVHHWPGLTPDQQEQLKGLVQVFLAEKRFEGCGGLTMTEEIRVTIAAEACLLLLGREGDCFPRAQSVLVYPSQYVGEVRRMAAGGFVMESEQPRLGESWYRGPVVLSWDDVLAGARDATDGHNVVLHEFAHQLDSEDGAVNGAPLLASRSDVAAWAEVMGDEYAHLVERIEHHHPSDIRPYAATSPAEFFAVTTEYFFERPRQLRRRHPELYEQFRAFYRQDPAARIERGT